MPGHKKIKPHQICSPPIVHLPSQAHAGTIKQYPFHKLVGIWSYEARSPSILKSQKRKARYYDHLHYFFLQNRNKNRIPRRVRGSRDLVNIVTAVEAKNDKNELGMHFNAGVSECVCCVTYVTLYLL